MYPGISYRNDSDGGTSLEIHRDSALGRVKKTGRAARRKRKQKGLTLNSQSTKTSSPIT